MNVIATKGYAIDVIRTSVIDVTLESPAFILSSTQFNLLSLQLLVCGFLQNYSRFIIFVIRARITLRYRNFE